MSNKEPASLPQLLETAMTLKYVGEYLLEGQIQGHECEAHLKAVAMVKAQFDQVNADVENHPGYPEFIAAQKAKKDA